MLRNFLEDKMMEHIGGLCINLRDPLSTFAILTFCNMRASPLKEEMNYPRGLELRK